MDGNTIRIADLKTPRLNSTEQALVNSAQPVSMTVPAVLKLARAETGLDNFGESDFLERLGIWLQCFDEDSALGPLGRATAFYTAVRYAANRLRVEHIIREHPEILSVKIQSPIIIAGLPRSGTTHLVNVLATNPAFRSMKLWETMEPVPTDASPSFEDSPGNPRYRRSVETWHVLTDVLPHWSAMHEMAPHLIHEDIELQAIDFSSYIPEWFARIPRWSNYYYQHDQTPHYSYGRRVLQAMTWLKGPAQWVMKSPPHMENLVPLFNTYPDATVVITHRDPVAVLQSALTMIAYWDRVRRIRSELPQLAEIWISRIERMLHSCVRDRDKLGSARIMDVRFHEYMADQRKVVDQVYSLANMPISPVANQMIEQYFADNPRGKLGQVAYDLQGDFGVDLVALRNRFNFYYDRFGVVQETVLGET